jgi:predicted RNA-binding protein with PIN domain
MSRAPGSASGRGGPLHVVVDAHNCIHADAQLRTLMGDPEAARAALERRLAAHARPGHAHVVVVHDGGPGGRVAHHHRHGLEAIYSGAGEADAAIVAWLQAHPQRRAVVVSDDNRLRARARALGAGLWHCRELLARWPAGRAVDGDDPERAPPGPAEVEQWLRIFYL